MLVEEAAAVDHDVGVRLSHKLAVLLVGAAALPIGAVGFTAVVANQRALEDEVRARFDQTAQHAAEAVAADVEGRALKLAETATLVGWAELSPRELDGALELVRRQTGAASAQLFLDGHDAAAGDPELAAHAPKARARKEGEGAVVYSAPWDSPKRGPALAAATAVPGGVLALVLPLGAEAARLSAVRADQPVALTLVDDEGRTIARAAAKEAAPPAASVIKDARDGKDGHARRYLDGANGTHTVVAAFAAVGSLGWWLLVEEDADDAFAASHRLRRLTLSIAGSAALLALALAFFAAGRLTRALERLAEAARAFGRGRLEVRLQPDSTDELGQLATTFNQMGEELARKRAEIEEWNRELEARVEARTAELKAAQAQLVQAQKLAALGQLGSGVAHEINNPLGGVLGHVQLLLADRSPDHPDYEDLRCIDEAARRASQVVQNLLRFSVQHKEPVRTHVDLNRLVGDTLSLTRAVLDEQHIALTLALDEPAPRARADQGQLAQVLLNLVSNARTAMPKGGTLTVRTQKLDGQVALTVEDTGKGIAPEIRERIFEPFFTTKDEWSNVGLGLSVSYRVVEDHGGRIEVASEPGQGARFTVYLPSAEKAITVNA